MSPAARRSVHRPVAVAIANLALLALLLALGEVGMRVHRDGARETVRRLLRGEPAPYSNLGTGNWVVDDREIGYRLNPARETVNELGIRGPEIAVPKPPGVFRLLVLGDSIPWDRSGFVDAMAELLRGRSVEVVNAAVPGYTSFQEVRFFERDLRPVAPDLVVWCYCLNDNHRFLHRFDSQAHMLFTDEAAESLRIRSRWDWIVSRSYLLSWVRLVLLAHREAASAERFEFPWEGRHDFGIAWKEWSWPAYEGQFRQMVTLTAERRARLALVAFPYEPQLLLRDRRERRDYILAPQANLARVSGAHGVPFLDLYRPFEDAYGAGRVLFRDGIHLNDEGHRLAAATLVRFLEEGGLLPGVALPGSAERPPG